jgi:hypothetical protein
MSFDPIEDEIFKESRSYSKFHQRRGGRFKSLVGKMLLEGVGAAMAIGLIALTRYLLQLWLGEDATFYDLIPVKWVFDTGDFAIAIRVVWRSFKILVEDD